MVTRQRILVALLALAFIAMAFYLAERDELAPSARVGMVLFGVLLVGLPWLYLSRPHLVGSPMTRIRGWSAQLTAACALAFASWLLASTILLPIAGYASFELANRPWFGIAYLALAMAYLPLVRRLLR